MSCVGCALSPVALVNRPFIARALPDGVRFADYVETDATGYKVTVAEKLARLGAHVGGDGKIYDLTGHRIEFFHHYDGGMPLPAGAEEAARKELEAMKKKYTVIEIRRDPALPPPR
jgi:hypothetical protein